MVTDKMIYRRTRSQKQALFYLISLAILIGLLLIIHHLFFNFGLFPESWNLGLSDPVDNFKSWVISNRATHPLFVLFFEPLSNLIDFVVRWFENFLLWLPWPIIILATFLLAQKIANLRLGLLAAACLFLMGLLGLWAESMQTLALMLIAVIISLLIGIPLGIWTAQNNKAEMLLRPVLDAMQTMPAFVYLIPVLLFFGVARVPSVVATVIYAIPPAVRLTNLGLRGVPKEAIEAARAFGSTRRQILYKVQLPMALPTIMTGVNQTIMMALGIVVIAALIGAGGLGKEVLVALRGLRVGQALEAGLAIVFMAILLDRISYAFSRIEYSSKKRWQGFRLLPEKTAKLAAAQTIEDNLNRLYSNGQRLTQAISTQLARFVPVPHQSKIKRHSYLISSLLLLVLLSGLLLLLNINQFPPNWHIPLRSPIDSAVNWMRINLYQIGDLPIGTGPFSDFITLYLLNPLRFFLTEWLSWPVLILSFVTLAYFVSGWHLAFACLFSLLLVGGVGMWELTMDTLSQVIVAVLFSVFIGIPLGILSARRDGVELVLRPLLDTIQTIPSFVYLVPVIMLFNLGRVPGIMASVLYALPPVVRLTNLGIRQVDKAAVEAAHAFGSTSWQTLFKVQLPLALPSIMLGINQTMMMVLAMVIISGLVGGGGLGFEVVAGLAQNQLGRGVEAGLAIVLLAIILDRITQAWAIKYAKASNLKTADR